MEDVMRRNTMTITGTPALTDGALTRDTDQALTFDGSTNSGSVTDHSSISFTGSMSVELFVNIPSVPSTEKNILVKASSYELTLLGSASGADAGKLQWKVINGGSSATVLSAVLTTGVWHHVIGVYNGDYAGVQQFGKTTEGVDSAQVDDANGNNKAVGQFTLVEAAILNTVTMSLQYIDELWPVDMRAVVYTNTAGVPIDLVTSSPVQTLNSPTPAWRDPTWVSFPLTAAAVPAGDYHIGYIADTVAGPLNKAPLTIGCTTTGGTASRRNDSVTSPSDPFGTVTSSNANNLDVYCDYTALARTGLEGKALLYVNGALANSTAYTSGIADNANALTVCSNAVVSVDEISVWDRALSPVEIGTHYTAH